MDSLMVNKKNTYKLIENTRKRLNTSELEITSGIPAYLLLTQREDSFLIHRSVEKNYEMIMFGTEKNLIYLQSSTTWLADGTFKSCPSEYTQLYIIFAPVMGKFVPILYILLAGKTISHYDKMFNVIKERLPNASPKYLIVDNEKSVQTSFLNYFSEGQIYLCFFHFSQCIYRNLQKNGLVFEYMNKKHLFKGISMLRSLIFVPEEYVMPEYNKVNFFLRTNVKKTYLILKNL
ncbi:hypothetical protein DMUE_0405 [Dictyocoela muelleri]|nr:hypothetical protein DMUE_0405 [Dictyocoela muelleri]